MFHSCFYHTLPALSIARQSLHICPIPSSFFHQPLPVQNRLLLSPTHLRPSFQFLIPTKHHHFRHPVILHPCHMPDSFQHSLLYLPSYTLNTQTIPHILHIYSPFFHLSQRFTISVTPYIPKTFIKTRPPPHKHTHPYTQY